MPVKLHREVIVQLPVKVVAEGKPEVDAGGVESTDAGRRQGLRAES